MSWQTEITGIVRQLINDTETPYTFSDTRIQQVICTATQFVNSEVDFDIDYVIDVVGVSITPDPTSPRDDLFISLVSMKSACILYRALLRTNASSEGVRVKDGMGEIEVKGKFAAFQDMAQSFCDAYQKAKLEYAIGNFATVRAIFNVASGPNINTFYDTHRGFYR